MCHASVRGCYGARAAVLLGISGVGVVVDMGMEGLLVAAVLRRCGRVGPLTENIGESLKKCFVELINCACGGLFSVN
jgi:hypothetical protein